MAKKTETALVVKTKTALGAVASVDPQVLLARAIDKNLPIEQMERLLTMRREMKMEWARDQFFASLASFQRECPTVEKKHKVLDKDRQTRAVKGERYRYAPLEDMVDQAKPYLEKWGFSFTFKSQQDKETVTAICHAHHRDGHEEVTSFQVPIDPDAYMSDPQKAAAALTFASRYAFKNAFGIQTKGEDRDEDLEIRERRAPVQSSQPRAADQPIPATHTVELSDFDKIFKYLGATEYNAVTKKTVNLFNPNEIIDYGHEANMAKDKPEELAKILADIVETGRKRRAAVKGEQA